MDMNPLPPRKRHRPFGIFTTSPSPEKVELGTQVIPLPKSLNRSPSIGQIWNARECKFQDATKSIFDANRVYTAKYLDVVPNYDMKYILSSGGDAEKKAELLDASVEVKLELPQFSVEGGIAFTKEDASGFTEEEFFCKYDVQTCVLRCRPSVLDEDNFDDVVLKEVYDDLNNGNMEGTHYISEIRYGGHATGRFRYSDKMTHDLFSLSGSVGGVVPIFAGISVGLSARVKFMTENNKDHKEIKVSAEAYPAPDRPLPLTLTQMFSYIEAVPDAVKATTKPPPAGLQTPITGVPISITLSPLAQIVPKLEETATYVPLDGEFLTSFTAMVLHLHDLSMDNPYKTRVLRVDPRLGIYFQDDDSNFNPWSLEVIIHEQTIVKESTEQGSRAGALFTAYKLGRATFEELAACLDTYQNSHVHPDRLKEDAVTHAQEGANILSTIRAHLAGMAGLERIFIFSRDKWDFWFGDAAPSSIRLATGSSLAQNFAEILYTLYELTPALTGLGIGVGIALPNVVSGFYMDSQMQMTQPRERYEGPEILEFLNFLKICASIKTVGKTPSNSVRFYATLSELIGLGSAFSWDVGNFNTLHLALKSQMNSCGKIVLCETSLQTKAALTHDLSEVNFVLFPQFLRTLHPSLKYWRELVRELDHSGGRYTTISACLDTLSDDEQDAPLMLVLDQNNELLYICYDKLDFLLVKKGIQGSSQLPRTGPLFPLTPNYLNVAAFSTAGAVASIISPLSTRVKAYTSQKAGQPFIRSGGVPLLKETLEFFKLAAFPPPRNVVGCAAKLPLSFPGIQSKLLYTLGKAGYHPTSGFPPSAETEWGVMRGNLVKLLEELEDEDEAKESLEALRDVVEFAESGNIPALVGPCNLYVNRYFKFISEEDSDAHTRVSGKISQLSNPAANRTLILLEVLHSLSLTGSEPSYSFYWEGVNAVASLSSGRHFRQLLEVMSSFTEEQKRGTCSSKKFMGWSLQFLHSSAALSALYRIIQSNANTIPFWFPKYEIREGLLRFKKILEGPVIPWKNYSEWSSLHEVAEILGTLLIRSVSTPMDFMEVLINQLKSHQDVKDWLEENNLLFFWDGADSHFLQAWGFTEILDVFQAIRDTTLQSSQELLKGRRLAIPQSIQVPCSPPTRKKMEMEPLSLNKIWAPFSVDGKFPRYSYTLLQSSVLDFVPNPLLLWDKEDLKTTLDQVIPFLLHSLRSGQFPETFTQSIVLRFLDYPSLDESAEVGVIAPKQESVMAPIQEPVPLWESLIQRVCLGGTPTARASFILKAPSNPETQEDRLQLFLSKSDLLTFLLSCGDGQLQSVIFKELSIRSFGPFPWFIPNVEKDTLELIQLTPALKALSTRGGLLQTPFKLLTVFRAGSVRGPLGKSTLLNKTLFQAAGFASKFESGYANGLPISREGLIELALLSQEDTHPDFYKNHVQIHEDTQILVANIHGDFLSERSPNSDTLNQLSPHTSGFLVFWSCSNWEEMSGELRKLEELFTASSKPLFHFVLDPHPTIAKELRDHDSVFLYSEDYYSTLIPGVRDALRKIITGLEPILQPEEIHGNVTQLISFIESHTPQKVRASLSLQNGREEDQTPPELKEIREQVLALFKTILKSSDSTRELWDLEHSLTFISLREKKTLLAKLGEITKVTLDLENNSDYGTLPLYNYSIADGRELLSFNSLSIHHLIRELSLEGALPPTSLQLPLSAGFPLELFSPQFFPDFNPDVLSALELIQSSHKFVTVSVLGPQGCGKSSLLNQIFGSAFQTHSFGCTDGIQIRLLNLPQAAGRDVDSILVLDTEGLPRPENYHDPPWNRFERHVGSLLLACSDFCVLQGNGGGNERLTEILEYFAALSCVSNKEQTPVKLLILEKPDTAGQVQKALLSGLENVRQLFQSFPLKSNLLQLFVPKVVDYYSGCFTSHNNFTFEDGSQILEFIYNNLTGARASFAGELGQIWSHLQEDEAFHPFYKHADCPQFYSLLRKTADIGKIKRVFDYVYEDHELYAEEVLFEDGNLEKALAPLNGLPYACPILELDKCYCADLLEELEKLEGDTELTADDQEEVQRHMASLRNDIISRMSQEFYAQEIEHGEPTSVLAVELRRLLEGGDSYPWVPFKRYLAHFITFPCWMGLLSKEEEEVYPFGLEENAESIWNFEKLSEYNQSPLDYFEMPATLPWQHSVWLDVNIERIVRTSSFGGGTGYKRGTMAQMAVQIEELLNKEMVGRMRENDELPLEPGFRRRVHSMGLVRMKEFFQKEWDTWKTKFDPLQVLETRKADFPNLMFPSEGESLGQSFAKIRKPWVRPKRMRCEA